MTIVDNWYTWIRNNIIDLLKKRNMEKKQNKKLFIFYFLKD